jgi:CHAT domain-containing protein/cytochrome c-type biogenesis protein CcmH/NrfG
MVGAEELKLRKYLLGQLTEAEEEQIELRLLTEPDFADEYDIVVNDVTDDYVAGKLEGKELEQAEQYFFKSTERRNKLKFALALKERKRAKNSYNYWKFHPYLAIAASLLVVVGAGFGVWRIFLYQNDLDKGLIALRSAFSKERPFEARLADFTYAPLSNVRGERAKVDSPQRDLAAILLLKEVSQHPSAASHHALGQYYLAERKVDQAIDQFNQALALAPNNAKIHSDLGAALLEQGRVQASGPVKGKEFETFARSLDHLNKALQLDGSLLEAYFNRALAYQYMLLRAQAEPAWREYLQRDSTSPWADEARRNLSKLEEDGGKTSRNADDAFTGFLAAFRAGDDDAAWKVFTTQYTSAGNGVTNKLLDSLLEPDHDSSHESNSTLPVLSYIARLEFSKAGEHYTSDLVRLYERALPTMRPAMTEARQHMVSGYGLFLNSNYKQAIGEYEAARLSYSQTGNEVELAFVDYRLAHCYIFLPDLGKADLAFKRLAATCETKGYLWLLGQTLFGLAHVSADSREYSKAIDYSGRALVIFERQGDVNGILKSLTQLADVNQWLNRVNRSLSYLSRGLALAEERQAAPGQQWSLLTQMALNMRSMQMYTAELLYHKEALRLALEMKIPLLMSRSYGYTGAAYSELGMYDEAVNEVTRAFEIGRGIQDKEIMAKSQLQLGDIRRQTNECEKAIQAYGESISLYASLQSKYYDYAAHKGKLFCLMRSADDQTVRRELQRVLALTNVYRSNITNQSQRDSFFDMEQGVYDLAISFESTRAKDHIRAYEYSEESRARSLWDAVQGGTAIEKNIYGPDLKLPNVTRNMSLAEVQKRMPGGAQILQYSVLEDRILVWIVTPSEIHSAEVLVGARSLTEKVRSYLATVNGPPSGNPAEARDQAKELYGMLIAPAEPFLDKSKLLCIVPDKILHYVSYDALVSPTTDTYLIESYETVVAPSSSTFAELSALAVRKAGVFEESLLSVGDPSFDRNVFDSLSDLPAAASEAQAVAELYNKKRKVLLREEARETIIKSAMTQADVAHLAMHYIPNAQSEMLSGFPLSPENSGNGAAEDTNGFLQFYEIYLMKLPRTRLVILSACQTGIEQQYNGEGAVSVARPFLVKGVPTVVASLWPVDSEASAELMRSFHRHRILDRLPVARALQRAKVEMIQGMDTQHRHPYYWAPFLPIGGATPY